MIIQHPWSTRYSCVCRTDTLRKHLQFLILFSEIFLAWRKLVVWPPLYLWGHLLLWFFFYLSYYLWIVFFFVSLFLVSLHCTGLLRCIHSRIPGNLAKDRHLCWLLLLPCLCCAIIEIIHLNDSWEEGSGEEWNRFLKVRTNDLSHPKGTFGFMYRLLSKL